MRPEGVENDPNEGDRISRARQLYIAYADGDREVVEELLASNFRFSSPVDVGLDRAGYFERTFEGGRVVAAEVYFGWDL